VWDPEGCTGSCPYCQKVLCVEDMSTIDFHEVRTGIEVASSTELSSGRMRGNIEYLCVAAHITISCMHAECGVIACDVRGEFFELHKVGDWEVRDKSDRGEL
jgi:hypothetical protein